MTTKTALAVLMLPILLWISGCAEIPPVSECPPISRRDLVLLCDNSLYSDIDLGVIFDRANNALHIFDIGASFSGGASFELYEANKLMRAGITDQQANKLWRYGKPHAYKENVWETSNLKDLSYEFDASMGEAFTIYRDSLDLMVRPEQRRRENCKLLSSWDELWSIASEAAQKFLARGKKKKKNRFKNQLPMYLAGNCCYGKLCWFPRGGTRTNAITREQFAPPRVTLD